MSLDLSPTSSTSNQIIIGLWFLLYWCPILCRFQFSHNILSLWFMTIVVFLIVLMYIYRLKKTFLTIIMFIELIILFVLYAIRGRIDLVQTNPPLQKYFQDAVASPLFLLAFAHFGISLYLWFALIILPQLSPLQVKTSNWFAYIFYLQVAISLLVFCAFLTIFPWLFYAHYSTPSNQTTETSTIPLHFRNSAVI